MTSAVLRTPGIVFEVRTPPLADPLPRMDVAVFVGFAAAGPLHLPVSVEGPAALQSIFGDDVLLGRCAEDGSTVFAQLGASVRSFFRAGGRRCWVVRVADRETAESSGFLLPGVLTGRPAHGATPRSIEAAALAARSPGSWADGLATNTAGTQRLISANGFDPDGRLRVGDVAAGDLLCLTYPSRPELVGYVPVPELPGRPGRRPARVLPVPLDVGYWFSRVTPATLWVVPPPAEIRPLESLATAAPATGATVSGWRREGSDLVIELLGSVPPTVRPGAWIRFALAPGLVPDGARALAVVGEIERIEDPALGGGPAERWRLATSAIWAELGSSAPPAAVAGAVPVVRAMALEVSVRGPGITARLGELGLAAPHPRFIGRLPDDSTLFGTDDGDELEAAFRDAVTRPERFPLAAFESDAAAVMLPLGVQAASDDEHAQPALHSGALPGVRDGLTGLSPALFLDPNLYGPPGTPRPTPASLLDDAFWVRYSPTETRLLPLRGIHSLLDIEEVSLACVPDASARHWTIAPRLETPFPPPFDLSLVLSDTGGVLAWTQPGPASALLIEFSADPRFEPVLASWRLAPLLTPGVPSFPAGDPWSAGQLFVRVSWSVTDAGVDAVLTIAGDAAFTLVLEERPVQLDDWPAVTHSCPERRFWRLAADSPDGRQSTWSETISARFPAEDFSPCPDDALSAPALSLSQPAQVVELAWSAPGPGLMSVGYRLEMSDEPRFLAGRVIYAGPSQAYAIWNAGDRIWYFRVSAEVLGRRSPWSSGVATGAIRVEQRLVEAATEYKPETLLAVHEALIVLAAARGDLVAVLGLAEHFHGREIADYRADLLARLGAADDLDRALSYAALYHPWPLVRETDPDLGARVLAVSPEGFAAGVMAERGLARGAWVAPANQLWPGVLGLSPATLEDIPAGGLPINVLVAEPRGFTTFSEWTLGMAGEVRTVHVRRLLILLRRIALRDGYAFAFQPNDDALSRLVQREFDALLGDLFERGAFAGRSRAEGYQVVTDRRINTPESREQGRFLVELRVAPSEPLSFLTIRLVQAGGDRLTVLEA